LEQIPDICEVLRPHFNGLLIANEQITNETGIQKIRDGKCDLASFGKWYVSNPDLAERILANQEVNQKFDYMTLSRGMNG
jgi:2,4-dienoyl-CoA reductase-like NADH-dependent reductase (Old Yellow Enzyme family)